MGVPELPDDDRANSVPPPRTRARWWQPPAAKWTGRLVFATAGLLLMLGAFIASNAATWFVNYDDGGWVLQWIALSVPWVVGAAVIAMRVRCGTDWRWLSYFGGILLVPVVLILFVIALVAWDAIQHMRSFDAAAWQAQSGAWGEDRVHMVDDLLDDTEFVGRPVAEIDGLLGPDDSDLGTGNWTGYFPERERIWHLGSQRGLISWNSEFLVLDVDEDGVITAADLVTD